MISIFLVNCSGSASPGPEASGRASSQVGADQHIGSGALCMYIAVYRLTRIPFSYYIFRNTQPRKTLKERHDGALELAAAH